jgi:hypothetical protein
MGLNKTLYDSAVMWMKSGKPSEALDLLSCIGYDNEVSPSAVGALKATAFMSRGLGNDFDKADDCLGSVALDTSGRDPMTWIQWSDLRMLQGRPKEASKALDTALAVDPNNTTAMIKRFNVCNALGEYEWALGVISSLYDIEPTPVNNMTYGMQLLLLSDERECLSDQNAMKRYADRYPDNKSIAQGGVYIEQGIGDVLMMLPYLVDAHGQCRDIIADNRHKGVIEFLSAIGIQAYLDNDNKPNGTWMFDLPLRYKHYEYAGHAKDAKEMILNLAKLYEHVFSAFKDKTILCLRGNPAHPNDRFRSIPFDAARQYIKSDGSKYAVVGHGLTDEEMAFCKDSGALVWDAYGIMPMASLVSSCKRVVTVDTAWGHMGGILGVDTSIMLSTLVDWRWGVDKSTTFRYPSVKLIRQNEFNQWGDVLANALK